MKTASNDTRTRRSCSTPSSQRQCAVKKGPANKIPTRKRGGGVRLEEGSGPRQHRPKKRRQEENRRVNQRWRARGARYGVPMGTMYRCMSMLPLGRVSPSCVSGLWETFFAAWMATFVACEARLLRPTAADLAALAAPTAEPPERPDPATFQGDSRNVCRVCLCKRLPRTPGASGCEKGI